MQRGRVAERWYAHVSDARPPATIDSALEKAVWPVVSQADPNRRMNMVSPTRRGAFVTLSLCLAFATANCSGPKVGWKPEPRDTAESTTHEQSGAFGPARSGAVAQTPTPSPSLAPPSSVTPSPTQSPPSSVATPPGLDATTVERMKAEIAVPPQASARA
jgi:hypothetical protein